MRALIALRRIALHVHAGWTCGFTQAHAGEVQVVATIADEHGVAAECVDAFDGMSEAQRLDRTRVGIAQRLGLVRCTGIIGPVAPGIARPDDQPLADIAVVQVLVLQVQPR